MPVLCALVRRTGQKCLCAVCQKINGIIDALHPVDRLRFLNNALFIAPALPVTPVTALLFALFSLLRRGFCWSLSLQVVRLRDQGGQAPGLFGAAGQDDSVKFLLKLLRLFFPDIHTGLKDDALGLHEFSAALYDALIQLHIGDAVHEKAPDPVLSLKHRDQMSAVIELVRRRQAGGTAPHDGDLFAAAQGGPAGLHPSVGKGCLYNIQFVVMHCDRLSVHAVDAGLLTQSRTDPSRKFREITGL